MPKKIGLHDHINFTPRWELYDIDPNNPEHLLFNSTICEFTDISGFPIQYYISDKNLDPLWGEDANNDYLEPFYTKIVYEPTEESSILDAFGISSDETLQYVQLPMDIFTRDAKESLKEIIPEDEYETAVLEPKTGDIITTIWNDRTYEIVFARRESNIFSARKFIWDIILRPYRFSQESDMAERIQYGDPTDFFDLATEQSSWEDDTPTAPPSGSDPPITKGFGVQKYGDNVWVEQVAEEQNEQTKHFEDLDDQMFQEDIDD